MADTFVVPETIPATGADREDFYNQTRQALPTDQLIDTDSGLKISGNKIALNTGVARVRKVSIAYDDFTAAGLSESITAFALSPGEFILGSCLHVTTAWVIAGMSTLDLELGIAADPDKYSGSTHTDGESTNDGDYYDGPANAKLESMASAVNILIKATSDAGNLDTASAGAVDLYIIVGSFVVI